jgi:hypothetical protein
MRWCCHHLQNSLPVGFWDLDVLWRAPGIAAGWADHPAQKMGSISTTNPEATSFSWCSRCCLAARSWTSLVITVLPVGDKNHQFAEHSTQPCDNLDNSRSPWCRLPSPTQLASYTQARMGVAAGQSAVLLAICFALLARAIADRQPDWQWRAGRVGARSCPTSSAVDPTDHILRVPLPTLPRRQHTTVVPAMVRGLPGLFGCCAWHTLGQRMGCLTPLPRPAGQLQPSLSFVPSPCRLVHHGGLLPILLP